MFLSGIFSPVQSQSLSISEKLRHGQPAQLPFRDSGEHSGTTGNTWDKEGEGEGKRERE